MFFLPQNSSYVWQIDGKEDTDGSDAGVEGQDWPQPWPHRLVDGVEDGDPEEIRDQREHCHRLEEEEHLGCHSQLVTLVEVIEEVLNNHKGLKQH